MFVCCRSRHDEKADRIRGGGFHNESLRRQVSYQQRESPTVQGSSRGKDKQVMSNTTRRFLMAWGYFLQCSCFGSLVTPLSPLRFDIDGGERRLIRRSRHRPAAKQGWGLFLKTGFWMVIGRTSLCRCAGKPCIEQSA
ncbi:hypothetical protein M431DRAFT_260941 [Trichoderma harzianum CBS 226.95]|uniref:Uncharacterized protein n=1 Tax=Trichoderma harzianum CBS 226.95 TaxID=983964 RepID=A0A2T3ZZ87_TRIHA|nr:hypothetical protein M431DRAFT_260941 [Trichoderma harzianum CBS 226.95]PTB50109.1 hypothetical protein M431DRAFT_260941 [Trichoderma harzianum CBS 226.95]